MRFATERECVTCQGSKLTNFLGRTKLTNSPGKQQLEISTCTENLSVSWCQANNFFAFFFYVWVGRYNKMRDPGKEVVTKHLKTGPAGNSEFCFPSTSMFASILPWRTLRVSGKQNSLFPLGPVIKCLNYVSRASGIDWNTAFSYWLICWVNGQQRLSKQLVHQKLNYM